MAKRITITSQALNKKPPVTPTTQAQPQVQPQNSRTTGLVRMPPVMDAAPVEETSIPQSISTKKSLPDSLKDGRYLILSDLPSHYRFYEFNELFIRPFTTNEAKLIYMAKKSNNLLYIINAVDACISEDVSKLLVQDFEFCLYWLRLNSYPKKPFKVEWTCYKEIALTEDNLKEGQTVGDLIDCEQSNLSTLTMTNMIINDFPDDINLPFNLMMPTMAAFEEAWSMNKDAIQLDEEFKKGGLELEEYEDKKSELDGLIYMASLAQWVKDGETLSDKLAILESQPDMLMQETIEEYIEALKDFGISETIEIKCQGCGGISRRRLEVDYISFFP